jgi:hypothetical protein
MIAAMSILPPDPTQTHLAQAYPVSAVRTLPGGAPRPALDRQWSALHRAAAAVATLAGLPALDYTPEQRSFPDRIASVGGWALGLARQGVADLAAVMEPGLTALISVHARGADPVPPARALLHEFTAARDGLLTLAPLEAGEA